MDIHLTASGTPGNVTQDLQKQIKALRESAPDAFPATLAGLRDDAAKAVQQQGGENVQADLHITLEVKSLEAKDVIRAFNAGEPLPVPGESTPPKRRASSDASVAEPATPPK